MGIEEPPGGFIRSPPGGFNRSPPGGFNGLIRFVRAAGALLDEVYRKRAADRMLHFLNVLGSRRHVFALRKAFRGVRLAAKVLQCAWRRAIRTSRARLEQLRSVWASVKERKLCELQNWAKMLVRMGQGPPAAWLEQRRDEFERRKARILRALPKTPRRPAFGPRRSSGGRGRRGVSGEEARALDVSAEHRDAHLKRYLRTRAGKAPRYALSGLCAAPFCASYGPFNGPFGVDDARDWVHGDHVDRAAHVMVTAFRNRKPTAPAFPDFRGLFSDVEVILRDAVRQRCVLGRIDSARRCLLGGAWRTWKLEMSARKLDGKRDSARPAVENCPQIAAPCGRAASARTPRGGGVYGGVAKPPPSGWVDMFIPSADKACSFRTRSAPTSPRSAEIDGAPPRCAVIEGASPRSALMGGEPKRLAGDSRRDSRRDSKRAPCSDENFAAAMSSPFPPARAKSANAVNAHRRHF